MKFLDDLLKDKDGNWKGEKIWTHIALSLYHLIAFAEREDLDLWQYALGAAGMHGAMFTANGVKNFLETKRPANVNVEKADVTVS